MASSNKQFLLEHIGLEHLRELAAQWRYPIADARLRAPGIAKLLARKRNVGVEDVLQSMNEKELESVGDRLGLDARASATELRREIGLALSRATWRQVRRENVKFPSELIALEAVLRGVVDGDTIRVLFDGEEKLVRLRGIDAPETGSSDKAERELDRMTMPRSEMVALGETATRRLAEVLEGRRLFLRCQPTPNSPQRFLHHHQYRLLAFASVDSPDGLDAGEVMLREGYALVWPRGLKSRRYSHQQAHRYIELCCEAFSKRPGLWRRGLNTLCPRHEQRQNGDALEICMASCFPGDPTVRVDDAADGSVDSDD